MWDYTPKQAAAFVKMADKRRKEERALQLLIAMMGARGKWDEAQKKVKEWSEQ